MQEREALIELLESPQHAPMIDHDSRTGECLVCPIPLHACSPDEIADALLAAGWTRPVPADGEVEAAPEAEIKGRGAVGVRGYNDWLRDYRQAQRECLRDAIAAAARVAGTADTEGSES